jgi:hypothetical protein
VLSTPTTPAGVDHDAICLRVQPAKPSRDLSDHPVLALILAMLFVFGMAVTLASLASDICGAC